MSKQDLRRFAKDCGQVERKVWKLGRQKSLERGGKPKTRPDIGVKFHQNLKPFPDFYSKV